MKTLRLLLLLITIHTSAQENNYFSFSAGSDVKGHLLTELTMAVRNLQIEGGYDTLINLDYSRMYFGLGYQFPLYMYPNGNEIRTTFAPSIQPSIIDRQRTWGGAFANSNDSSHISVALNLALMWELSDNFIIGYSLNVLPRTDLKSKFPEELWSEKLVLSATPVSLNSFFKLTYKINY